MLSALTSRADCALHDDQEESSSTTIIADTGTCRCTSSAAATLGHARQAPAAVVCLLGLCAGLRLAPHRPGTHAPCKCDLRHDPAEALEDRRPGARLGAPYQDGRGVGLPRIRSGMPEYAF